MSVTPSIAPAPAGPTHTVHGYAALERDAPITPFDFEQREPRPDDVAFDVLFCGICHTDLHSVGPSGHRVTGLEVGAIFPVRVIVASWGKCAPCRDNTEIYCENGPTNTYDGLD